MILWVDVETTGLEPRDHYLLEVGLVLTTDDLHQLSHTSVVIKPAHPKWRNCMDDYVKNMHKLSGLIDECETGVPVEAATALLRDWIKKTGVDKPPMGGSSVHFDRMWLAAEMPMVERLFHYRNIDVSTVKELNKRWRRDELQARGQSKHRALDDLQATLDEARYYRTAIFGCAA